MSIWEWDGCLLKKREKIQERRCTEGLSDRHNSREVDCEKKKWYGH